MAKSKRTFVYVRRTLQNAEQNLIWTGLVVYPAWNVIKIDQNVKKNKIDD